MSNITRQAIGTADWRAVIGELESAAMAQGFERDLAAARDLARDGLDGATIDGMMRGLFSPTQIAALIAEAQAGAHSGVTGATIR